MLFKILTFILIFLLTKKIIIKILAIEILEKILEEKNTFK